MFEAALVIPIAYVSAVLAGHCRAPSGADAVARPVRRRLLAGKGVRIQVVHVNGVSYPRQAVDDAIARLARYMDQPPQREPDDLVEARVNESGQIGAAALEALIQRRRCTGPSDITVIVGPDAASSQYNGLYILQPNGSHVVILHGPRLESRKPPVLSRQSWWSIVLSHELFHTLGLPADRRRCWRASHCRNPGCILYARVDWRSVCRTIADFGPPRDLCRDCQRELREAGAGDDSIPPDEFSELGEIIRLNPQVAWPRWRRSQLLCDRGDYAVALADQNQAIALNPADGRAYVERAHIHVKLGRLPDAGDDFLAALRLSDDEQVTRNARNNLIRLLEILPTLPGIEQPRAVAIVEALRRIAGPRDNQVAACCDQAIRILRETSST